MTKTLTVVTHSGTFHTDDVFACAALRLVHGDITIIRSRKDEDFIRADILVDVGGEYDVERKRFDHHQKGGAGTRENGIPYASFGLVWKAYGAEIAGDAARAAVIDEQLVQAIDAHDNGFGDRKMSTPPYPYVVGDIISSMRPTWKENESYDEVFMKALELATTILTRLIVNVAAYAEAEARIESAYAQASDKRAVELPQEYPGWKDVLGKYAEPLYIVYQRSDGAWGIKGIPVEADTFVLRKAFPESWGGLRDEQLQKVTGVADALFCHANRFLVVASSKDGIVKLLEQTLNA